MTGWSRRESARDRAVQTTVSYVITVGIALALVTGLIAAGTTMVEDQNRRTTESQLRTIGHQVAGTLELADRTVRASDDVDTLNLTVDLPDQVVGSEYYVDVDSDLVAVSASGVGVSMPVDHTAETDVRDSLGNASEGSYEGGRLYVTYDTDDEHLKVNDD
ncbi:DUF7266 family protein [Halomicrobium urmianum]|uniref:DUF7266 family protein n=1 Tax=Halomicrobium urmianum TaxID=1586233 RepID=UPI001CD9BDC5|nr:hypothetical protein [Halomicrobium urmianum]